MKWLAMLVCLVMLAGVCQAQVTYFDELRIGVAYELANGKAHSDLSTPAVRYTEWDWLDLSWAVGIMDYQNLSITGEDWFYDLQISNTIEANFIKLAKKVPVLDKLIDLFPKSCYAGIGHSVYWEENGEEERDLKNCWIAKISAQLSF